jgi:hypothetical protein
MARREGKPIGDIASALMQREWMNFRSSDVFMPAGEPLKPNIETKKRNVRTFDFPALYNTLTQLPLGVEPDGDIDDYNYHEIRKFADEHEITRLVIETCKEQLCKLRWTWRLVPKLGQTKEQVREESEKDKRCKFLNDFFKSPDKEHTFSQWLRMIIEELLVCDSVVLWAQPDFQNSVYAVRQIDVATIKRCIDDMGVTPSPMYDYPDNIAYQQVIKGMITGEFTTDQMIYYTRNPRVHKLFGYSIVEQIMLTLATGMQRMAFQLAHYTEGNVPAMFLRAPKEWGLDQIKTFQEYWNALMSGNLGELAKGWMIPGDVDPVFPQAEVLKDDFDEWIARVVCYAFSVSPNAFIKNLNRATSEQAREQADEEGLQSRTTLITEIMNLIQERWFGFVDVEFHLLYDRPQDSKKQAEIDNMDIRNGTKSVDEVRRERGLPPIGAPNRIYTNNGFIPLTPGDEGQFDVFRQELIRNDSGENQNAGNDGGKDASSSAEDNG